MQFGIREIIFTLKSFAGAMLALLIAFLLDLEKPSWAVLTAYIVAQPFAGMVQSKALYRVIGTLAGGAMAVAALGNLSSASALLALVLALWLGLCVYLSLLDRTARSYSFMLAGYTAAIIAFPAVDTPGDIFNIAVARCEEIIIGIGCAVIASELIFPQRAGAALQRRIDAWLNDAAHWIEDVLVQKADQETAIEDQSKLVSDSLVVNTLQEHAVFDTPRLRGAQAWIFDLQRRMHRLMAVLGSIGERLAQLREQRPELLPGYAPLLRRVASYVRQDRSRPIDPEMRAALIADIDGSLPSDREIIEDQHLLLLHTVIARLKDLMRFWDECRHLHQMILEERPAPESAVPLYYHRDHLMALLGGSAAAIAILLTNTFWVFSAWPSGSGAVIQAGVLCSLFAASDNSAALSIKFLNGTVIGTVLAGIYVLFLLPPITGFVPLVCVLALFYLPYGLMLATPSTAPAALPVILGFTVALSLQNNYSQGFDTFLNNGLASILGIAAAVVVLRLFRTIGSDWIVARLVAATRRDLAKVSVADRGMDRDAFEGRIFDRLNGLLLRRRPDNTQMGAIRGTLASLRVGLNLFLLQEAEPTLSPMARKSTRQVRAELARLFRKRWVDPQQFIRIETMVDAAIRDIALDEITPLARQAILALGAIRMLLSCHNRFFAPLLRSEQAPSAEMVTA